MSTVCGHWAGKARACLGAVGALFFVGMAFQVSDAKAQALYVAGSKKAPTCSNAKMNEILAPATKGKATVTLDCSPKLNHDTKIFKRLVLKGAKAQGIVIDCGGGVLDGSSDTVNFNKDMISIQSVRNKDGSWSVPSNIIVRNCEIRGSIRIFGMSQNGEGAILRESSHTEGHTARARYAAPSHIWFDKITLIGQGRIPFYVSPGTTHVSVSNSTFSGETNSTAIYLDAESANNIFFNNRIGTKTKVRELIAVDGSSHNKFINNYFSSLGHGGIYVYRNCGEGGTVRHATPSWNQFINNTFFYNKFKGININLEKLADLTLSFKTPAIWIASRNGGKSYCGDDNGFGMGSSKDDRDFARHNVIAQNQIFKLSPDRMISIDDQPNIVKDNVKVTARIERPAGCFIENGEAGDFLKNGEQRPAPESAKNPDCPQQILKCSNGLIETPGESCRR